MLRAPYLLFLGDAHDPLAAKVAQGIHDWRPEKALGQYRMAGCQADLGIADMTIAEAAAQGAGTLVVGVANQRASITSLPTFRSWSKPQRPMGDSYSMFVIRPRHSRLAKAKSERANVSCRLARIAPAARCTRLWRWKRKCRRAAGKRHFARRARRAS